MEEGLSQCWLGDMKVSCSQVRGDGNMEFTMLCGPFWGPPGLFMTKIFHLSMLYFSVMFKSCDKMTHIRSFPRDHGSHGGHSAEGGVGASHTLGPPARPAPGHGVHPVNIALDAQSMAAGANGQPWWEFSLTEGTEVEA